LTTKWPGETCDRCGREQRAAWAVTDDVWRRVGIRDDVVCLECFFKEADEMHVNIVEKDFIFLGFATWLDLRRPIFIDRTET
jgi:hypothetical protein